MSEHAFPVSPPELEVIFNQRVNEDTSMMLVAAKKKSNDAPDYIEIKNIQRPELNLPG